MKQRPIYVLRDAPKGTAGQSAVSLAAMFIGGFVGAAGAFLFYIFAVEASKRVPWKFACATSGSNGDVRAGGDGTSEKGDKKH